MSSSPIIEQVVELYEASARLNALAACWKEVSELMEAMGEYATATEIGKKVRKYLRDKCERLERQRDQEDPLPDDDDDDAGADYSFPESGRVRAVLSVLEDVERDLQQEYSLGSEREVDMEREEAIEAVLRKISRTHSMVHETGYYIDKHFDELMDIVPERERGKSDRRAAREMRAAAREFANADYI